MDIERKGLSSNPNFSTEREERKAIWKNLVFISLGFTLLFTAFTFNNLQSSINPDVGTVSLSTMYGGLVFGCMFLPKLFIRRFTAKWTIAICMVTYATYMVAQFYPEYYTLVPTAILLGMGAGPMWSAKCTYLTQAGTRLANLNGTEPEQMIVRFFGLFFLFFQSSNIWGNVISTTVLSAGAVESSVDTELCGANFCPDTPVDPAIFQIDDRKRYILSGVYLASALLGALFIALAVDPLSKFTLTTEEEESLSGKDLIIATFKHLTNPCQVLLIPLTMWSGLEQGYFTPDFTAGFVTCSWGVSNVGLVLIAYGVTDALCSIGFSLLMKYVGGRIPIFILGAILNYAAMATMFLWQPNKESVVVYFAIAVMWGMADAVWQTQINALYGYIFAQSEEAAFSNYRLWESIGFIIAFAYGSIICVKVKLCTLLVVLTLGMLGYLSVEFLQWRKSTKTINK